MKKLLLLTLIVAMSSPGFGQVKKNLELLDIFNMEYVSDPQISPDGKQIVYVRNFKDVMTDRNLSNLWIINADGTKNRPLTNGNQNDSSPRWSHDGTRIAFRSNMEDSKTKLYLMWLDTREVMALTNTPNSPGAVTWAPNDEHVAFTMFVPASDPSPIKLPAKPEGANWNTPPTYIDELSYRRDGGGYVKPGNSQIFTLPVSGGTPRQLTFEAHNHGDLEWSKDGSHLFFSANYHDESEFKSRDSDIYRIAISDGSVTKLTDRFGQDSDPKVSPDGKTIAYLGYDDKYLGYQSSKLYLMNADGSNKREISGSFDRGIGGIEWAADGKGVYFEYTDKGDGKLAYISTSGKVTVKVEGMGGLSLGRPYNSAAFSVASNGRAAYTLGGGSHPADLAIYDGKSSKRLTYLNDDLFAARNIGKVEEIWWKSSHEQLDIQGWIVTPPDFDPNKKYPLILEIHGGPFASYGNVFSAEVQAYAAAGYVVLYTNPRGSTGYGMDFANEIHHNYPNNDYDDLMSGVDAVIAKGYVDENNLFVTGGSGGGVLSAWIVGKTDRFKAAVVAKPVINWYSFVLYSDGTSYHQYWFSKKPWEDPEQYLKRSPLSYVANVTTPTMLLTGEEDFRTPIPESEQFYRALKLEGVETALVRIPGASHGIANRPSNLVAKIASVLTWFEKYKD